jgi:hypothetical protein
VVLAGVGLLWLRHAWNLPTEVDNPEALRRARRRQLAVGGVLFAVGVGVPSQPAAAPGSMGNQDSTSAGPSRAKAQVREENLSGHRRPEAGGWSWHCFIKIDD